MRGPLYWRLLAKVKWPEDPDGCWIWTGGRASGRRGPPDLRYGIIQTHGNHPRNAHLVMWEFCRGPVPDGLQLDHLCRNRICVNPAHLEPVTQYENWRRGESISARALRSDVCRRGLHPKTPENRMGHRCRPCWQAWQREYARATKGA